jgi:hypothetical protein
VLEILEGLIKVTIAFREWRITGGLNSSQKIKLLSRAVFIAELDGYKAIETHFKRLNICYQ